MSAKWDDDMIPAERQQHIRHALDRKGMVSIAEMAAVLGVSKMTVRRDMQELQKLGHVTLVSGGAKRVGRFFAELSLAEKCNLQNAEKLAIAREAATLAGTGDAIYFDAGTTCLAVADAIIQRPELRDSIIAVTNDLTIANHLILKSNCRLYHTGGEILRDNKSCIGELTSRVIRSLNIDLAFLSASSWNHRWMSTPNEAKIMVKTAAMAAAEHTVLVSDSTKYGKAGFFNVIKLTDLDGVITDTGLSMEAREQLARSGANVTLVPPLEEAAPESA